jgi:hypothetical protein
MLIIHNYVKKTNSVLSLNVGGDVLEFVMSKIMSIDKDAESYRGGIDELLKEKQNQLENIIKDMLADFQEETKNIKNYISNEKIIEAEYRARNIRKEKEEQLNSINAKYQSNKLEIVDEVFRRIIKSL